MEPFWWSKIKKAGKNIPRPIIGNNWIPEQKNGPENEKKVECTKLVRECILLPQNFRVKLRGRTFSPLKTFKWPELQKQKFGKNGFHPSFNRSMPDPSPSIAIIAHSISVFSSPLSLPLNSPLTKSSPFPLAIIKVHELASECRQTNWKKSFCHCI